jgi:O-antigen/teichoic acid export membrane protein
MHRLYSSSLRYLILLLVPVFAVLLLFGGEILSLWMGPAFSNEARIVLQIMSLGALLNCLAYIPLSALQAAGRPDLTGKFHLLELAAHVALCFFLIPRYGLVGAAIAGTLRYVADAVLLFGAVYKTSSLRVLAEPTFARTLVLSSALTAGLVLVRFSIQDTPAIFVGIAMLLAYGMIGWRAVLCAEDKALIGRLLRLRTREAQ